MATISQLTIIAAVCLLLPSVLCNTRKPHTCPKSSIRGRHQAFKGSDDANKVCNTCEGTTWLSADCPGSPVCATSALECCELCRKNGKCCVAYVYDSKTSLCYLKKFPATDPASCKTCTSQNTFEQLVNFACIPKYEVDRPGGDLGKPIATKDPNECCRLCKKSVDCKAWVWRRDQNKCYLKKLLTKFKKCPACVTGQHPGTGL